MALTSALPPRPLPTRRPPPPPHHRCYVLHILGRETKAVNSDLLLPQQHRISFGVHSSKTFTCPPPKGFLDEKMCPVFMVVTNQLQRVCAIAPVGWGHGLRLSLATSFEG